MPQGSSPMWFGVAAGLHLGNFRAVQLGFSLLLVLPAASWNSSSGNLLPNEAADLVGWDSQKNQLHGMNTPTNPSPTSLQPQPRFTSTELQFQTCCPHTPKSRQHLKPELQLSKTTISKPARLQVW